MGLAIRVLLIEDNPGDAKLVARALSQTGHDYEFVVEHVDRLGPASPQLSGSVPDVILLDLHLPDSSGLETLRSVHQMAPDIPIIVMTNEQQASVILDCVKNGAKDYFVKERLKEADLVDCIVRVVRHCRAIRGHTPTG